MCNSFIILSSEGLTSHCSFQVDQTDWTVSIDQLMLLERVISKATKCKTDD